MLKHDQSYNIVHDVLKMWIFLFVMFLSEIIIQNKEEGKGEVNLYWNVLEL